MSPKLVNKDHRKREIALAALDIFAKYGFEGTSISRVAEAAGISKGSVYLYFNSKIDLIVAAAEAWVVGIEERFAPLSDADQDPLTRLRTLFRESTRAFLNDPRMIMLFLGIVQIALRDRALLERLDVVKKVSAPIRKAICEILSDGVAQGVFRSEVATQAERIAVNLVAYVDGIGMHYLADPDFFDLSEQINFYLEGMISSLRVSSADESKEHRNE